MSRRLTVETETSAQPAPDFDAWLSSYVETVLRLEGVVPSRPTEQDSAA